VQNKAIINIDCSKEKSKYIYHFSFQIFPPPLKIRNEVSIYLNQMFIEKIISPLEYHVDFLALPGENYELRFVSYEEKTTVSGDGRSFVFMLRNLSVIREKEILYPDEGLKAIQKCQLCILKKFTQICEENKLNYCGFYGTMLGAVRHRGFIPWDDDIDVAMPRKDFDRFIKIFQMAQEKEYYLDTMENSSAFWGGYAKLGDRRTTLFTKSDKEKDIGHGISIDIFPLDYYEENFEKRKKQLKRIGYLQKLILEKTYGKSGLKAFTGRWERLRLRVVSKIFKREFLLEKLNQLFRQCNESKYMTVLSRNYLNFEREFYNSNIFSEQVFIMFDNVEIKIPREYDKCLAARYGKGYILYSGSEANGGREDRLINAEISYLEIQKHLIFDILDARKLLIIGDIKSIEKYLKKDKNKKDYIYIYDIFNQSVNITIENSMVIEKEEAISLWDRGVTVLVCTQNLNRIINALMKYSIDNYYIYMGDL
jgi:phosphorylcholine metabolism protein LicD